MTTGQAATGAPVLSPAPPNGADLLLAAYPHIAGCPSCRRYAAEWAALRSPVDIVIAALAHHESGHTFDPLTTVTQHFASPV